MKKTYMTPQQEVIEIQNSQMLLAGSTITDLDTTGLGIGYGGGGDGTGDSTPMSRFDEDDPLGTLLNNM